MTTIGEMIGRYGCPVCGKRFYKLAVKKTHMKIAHPKKR